MPIFLSYSSILFIVVLFAVQWNKPLIRDLTFIVLSFCLVLFLKVGWGISDAVAGAALGVFLCDDTNWTAQFSAGAR